MPDVLVVGAGVSGLTTAVCLAEAGGYRVRLRAQELPPFTTSCAAGAIWDPYLLTDERELRWSTETRHELTGLANPAGSNGVRLVSGCEASMFADTPTPSWATELPDFRQCTAAELPAHYQTGWWHTAPVVDMPVYLNYLGHRFERAGGQLSIGELGSLPDGLRDASVVVNCTGIGARRLTGDTELTPTRGQLVLVRNPGLRDFFVEYDDSPTPTYFLPHGDYLVLGGSAEPGRTDREPDLATAAAIQARCAVVEPRLADAEVIAHRVGLRPTRDLMRLEREAHGGGHIIHNYGHSGAGVTVSWGCAREVVRLVAEVAAPTPVSDPA
jgi:D-amino-acid oxidase